MRPYPSVNGVSYWLIPQCIGVAISFAGLLSLNRGFGIMVGNRGIHSKGMYRFIRHPLYAGYFLTIFSFLVQHLSLWNIAIFILFFVLQIFRIRNEENFLAADPTYVKYVRHTKWRLVPGIW
jgi:protein-S-isoprenylcysteine O-methyltransferase Ste14